MSDVANELAIRQLLATYCHHCDDGRFAELLQLFAPDGCFVRGATTITGHAALRAFFEDRQGRPEQRGRHLTVNTVVELDAGRARALSDFVHFRFVDGRITPAVAGRYRDELVRMDDGRWRFARREVEDWSPPA
jgi:3-phenylpropionate/cinnamic acid dioxygenase small subunit